MNEDNHELVGRALNKTLREILAPYVAQELSARFKNDWWQRGVLDELYNDQKLNLPISGDFAKLTDSMDVQLCLILMNIYWKDIFSKKLSINHFNWIKELNTVRNQWAHTEWSVFTDSYTARALDTMARLCEQLDDENTGKLRDMWRKKVYGDVAGSLSSSNITSSTAEQKGKVGILQNVAGNLKSWRDVMSPHPDVAEGRYRQAEFMADLWQVAHGEGSVEYLDPVEFFSRTYITAGMNGLLQQALQRLVNGEGEPVIQLKTSFGGGKTHSMLALYHLFRGKFNLDRSENVRKILAEANMNELPKDVKVAVIVGTPLNPAKSKRPINMPGITINTLWGEIAAQLAFAAGNPRLYEHVKEADKKGVSPGSDALKNLFDECGACLILIDELVAYGKKIYGVEGLPAGTFDNLITFVQELTEAAKSSQRSMVVASLPESEIEVGGTAGKEILEQVEHTFGRVESIWKPVTANESFEVVRRRLFLDCQDEAARDQICTAFSKMYQAHSNNDFPVEAKDLSYKEEMIACYPIHPEFFHYLYDEWATIDHFQKTRGVLRLMAGVIYYLWINNDASCMIMPGSIPLNISKIRDELSRYLPENWNAIVDSEVDGKDSEPFRIDKNNARFGKVMAARRMARTIFLGSAPTVRGQTIRGVEESHIRLGVVQPYENIADFNDALSKLKTQLSYLYSNETGSRFWYDNRPTLRKLVQDLEQRIADDSIEDMIEKRLRKWKAQDYFKGLHICPTSSLDVFDEQNVRLVILPLNSVHERGKMDSQAMVDAEEFLNKRGHSARQHKNMLIFLAPDKTKMADLQKIVRRHIAWQIIHREAEDRNLDTVQIREAKNQTTQSENDFKMKLSQAYCWIFSPYTTTENMRETRWDILEIDCKNEENIEKAEKRLKNEELIIPVLGAVRLKMELDQLLWKDRNHIELSTLWGYFSDYCYLPRLMNIDVLFGAIHKGVESGEFAIAEDFNGEKYLGLQISTTDAIIYPSTLLIKKEVAEAQIEGEKPKENISSVTGGVAGGADTASIDSSRDTISPVVDIEPPPPVKNTRFSADFSLDGTRLEKDFNNCFKEVLKHLLDLPEVKTSVWLSAEVTIPGGTPKKIANIVTENCRTLKAASFHFDDR